MVRSDTPHAGAAISKISKRIWGWLVGEWQWPYAALFTGCALLALAPLWFHFAGGPLGWVHLQLPIYMLHQGEEHAGDRFRLHANRVVAGGREKLALRFPQVTQIRGRIWAAPRAGP